MQVWINFTLCSCGLELHTQTLWLQPPMINENKSKMRAKTECNDLQTSQTQYVIQNRVY